MDDKNMDFNSIHKRWMNRRNRRQESSSYKDEWYGEQCGACQYFVPLTGQIGSDYGACTNALSAFDGMVRFEHDGCPEYKISDEQ